VQRKKIEQQLRRVTRAVEQCHITIMITNREGMIEYVNPAFTLSSGYRPEEVLGKSIEILRPEECDEELYRNIMHTLETKGLWRGEVENRRKDGSPYWMFAAISSVKDEDGGKVTHYVAVKQDVTKRKMAAMYLLRHPLPGS
jgi:PAS domain S-box-containing protein